MYRDNKETYMQYSTSRRLFWVYLFSPLWIFSIIFVPSIGCKLLFLLFFAYNIYSTKFADHLRDLHAAFGFPQEVIMNDFPPIVIYRESVINIIKYICFVVVLLILIF